MLARPFQKAFTLVELLVVLVIVGLMVTLIMQGFTYSMGVYQRVVVSQKNAYSEAMAAEWFRSAMSTQVAARQNEKGLIGNDAELTTATYNPLLGEAGVRARIGWKLAQDGNRLSLIYIEMNQELVVQSWIGANGKFEYLDKKGKWTSYWPPIPATELAVNRVNPLLPVAVRILIRNGQEIRYTLATVETRLLAEPSREEVYIGQ